ncbi:MAG TPA: DUF2938 domain-containing protein [Gammaproteobacteria bacterium]
MLTSVGGLKQNKERKTFMGIENSYMYIAILVGLGATLIMDIWALIARKVFNIALPNYCFVGRWLSYMPAGTFSHPSIAAAAKKSAECFTGWVFHYLTGVAYAFILVIATSGRWLEAPTLLPALVVGIGTIVIPYFIMQPSFGLGIAAAKTPNPTQARLRSLMAHTSFGVGLYLAAYALSYVVRTYA